VPDFYTLLRRAATGLLVLAVATAVATAAGLSALRLNGYQLLTVQSGSMAPVLKIGDAIITGTKPAPRLGEIISYRSQQDSRVIISHRLVAIDHNQLITAGDVLGSKDPPIARSRVLGRVIVVLPGFGRLLNLIRQPWCQLSLIYIPAAGLLLNELNRLAKHFSRPRYQLFARR
jgi:signal peptidase I